MIEQERETNGERYIRRKTREERETEREGRRKKVPRLTERGSKIGEKRANAR